MRWDIFASACECRVRRREGVRVHSFSRCAEREREVRILFVHLDSEGGAVFGGSLRTDECEHSDRRRVHRLFQCFAGRGVAVIHAVEVLGRVAAEIRLFVAYGRRKRDFPFLESGGVDRKRLDCRPRTPRYFVTRRRVISVYFTRRVADDRRGTVDACGRVVRLRNRVFDQYALHRGVVGGID